MALYRVPDCTEIIFYLFCYRLHPFDIFHDKKFRLNFFYCFNITFIKMISRIVYQPLSVSHTKSLAMWSTNNNVSTSSIQQFIKLVYHIFYVSQYNMVSGCLRMVMCICIHTTILDIICQGSNKSFLCKS